ncbi:thermonuclease family protein [Rhodobacter sp. Har01]|uniref:thermonuclease family protein n=1 Tax=Rhodobacter sp. Har01 TaxID=2883999 RepID=UPI001D063F31|nr:thermonuclease family protein [Rhodobacter sp. Har01]MCB6177395.1 thermonuclease family protein [Rhodobacter sp. Har01]
MRLDATLFAYVVLTGLVLVRLWEWADPTPLPGGDCRVGHVYDGDTVELVCPGQTEAARLIGIDTPELDGACAAERAAAQAAKAALAALVKAAREVTVGVEGQDRYGRPLVHLRLDGIDAALAMLKAGHGRPYDGGRRAGWCG